MRLLKELGYCVFVVIPFFLPWVIVGFLARELVAGLKCGWALSKMGTDWFLDPRNMKEGKR